MPERKERSYPTNWVSKNDLYLARPDLHAEIENLEDGGEAILALKEYVLKTIVEKNVAESFLAHYLVERVFQHEVNWRLLSIS